MKKNLIVLAVTVLALCVLAGGLLAQKKPGFLGAWTGYYIVGDGSRVDVNLSFDKDEAGYTGKLSDASGMIPESPFKNIVFKDADGKLTFEFDLMDDDGGSQLIKIELILDKETLKGHWFDAEGNSDIIELTLKK
jgi:hypothetical protein